MGKKTNADQDVDVTDDQDVDAKPAVENRIRVRFLEAENESLGDIFVGLNGREYLIQRNKEVELPESVLNVINDAVETRWSQNADGERIGRQVKAYPYELVRD